MYLVCWLALLLASRQIVEDTPKPGLTYRGYRIPHPCRGKHELRAMLKLRPGLAWELVEGPWHHVQSGLERRFCLQGAAQGGFEVMSFWGTLTSERSFACCWVAAHFQVLRGRIHVLPSRHDLAAALALGDQTGEPSGSTANPLIPAP